MEKSIRDAAASTKQPLPMQRGRDGKRIVQQRQHQITNCQV